MKHICRECNEPLGRHSYAWFCFPCLQHRSVFQWKAILTLRKAIRNGLLPKITADTACADCGEPAHGYDHRDYTKPLQVDPVCRSCNWHRGSAFVPKRRPMKVQEARA